MKVNAAVIWLYLIQISNFISTIGVSSYAVKNLDLNSTGIVLFGFSFISILTIITDLSYNNHGISYAVKNKNNKNAIKKYLLYFISIKLHLFGILYLLFEFLVLIFSYDRDIVNYLRFAIASSLMSGLIPAWLFQGLDKIKIWALAHICGRCLFFISVVFYTEIDIMKIGLINLIAFSLTFIICIYRWVDINQVKMHSYSVLYKHLKLRIKITRGKYIHPLISLLPQAALMHFDGSSQRYIIMMILDQIWKVANGFLVPIFNYSYISRCRDKDENICYSNLKKIFLLVCISAIAFFIFGGYLIEHVYGVKVGDSLVYIFYILIISLSIISLYLRIVYISVFFSIHEGNILLTIHAFLLGVALLILFAMNSINVYSVVSVMLICEMSIFIITLKKCLKNFNKIQRCY